MVAAQTVRPSKSVTRQQCSACACLPGWYSMAGPAAAVAASARAARAGRNSSASSASGASSGSLNALEAGARVFDIAWAACLASAVRGTSAAFSRRARTPEHALPSLLDRAMASVCIAQAAWVPPPPLRAAHCAGKPCYARTARGGSAGLPDVGGCLRPSAVSWGTVTLHTHWSSQLQAPCRAASHIAGDTTTAVAVTAAGAAMVPSAATAPTDGQMEGKDGRSPVKGKAFFPVPQKQPTSKASLLRWHNRRRMLYIHFPNMARCVCVLATILHSLLLY